MWSIYFSANLDGFFSIVLVSFGSLQPYLSWIPQELGQIWFGKNGGGKCHKKSKETNRLDRPLKNLKGFLLNGITQKKQEDQRCKKRLLYVEHLFFSQS
jgi:hypothetical protein